MKRRNFIAAWLVTLLAPFRLWGEETIPVHEAGHIPVRPAEWPTAKKALQWACMCLRRGGHWTIGAISAAIATIGQVRHHLVSVHGHSYGELASMSKEQMLNLHDASHEGRSYRNFHFPPTPPNGLNRMPQSIMDSLPRVSGGCPGGVCPTSRFRRS